MSTSMFAKRKKRNFRITKHSTRENLWTWYSPFYKYPIASVVIVKSSDKCFNTVLTIDVPNGEEITVRYEFKDMKSAKEWAREKLEEFGYDFTKGNNVRLGTR